MKMLVFAVVIGSGLMGLTQPGFAQSKPETVKGYLLDVMCGTAHASEGIAYAETHDKKCFLEAACVKSGYLVLTADNRTLKFDAKGNQLALELIKKSDKDKDWRVVVSGTVSKDTIAVGTLSLQ